MLPEVLAVAKCHGSAETTAYCIDQYYVIDAPPLPSVVSYLGFSAREGFLSNAP